MQVNLARGWFGPDGGTYSPSGNPHTFPDNWGDRLPTSATVLPDLVPEPEAKKPSKGKQVIGDDDD